MKETYQKKQLRLEAQGRETYPDVWDTLTKEQKILVKKTFSEIETEEKLRFLKPGDVHHEGQQAMSIESYSGKQEPDSFKISYGEGGESQLAANNHFHEKLDTREDRVRECVFTKGNLKRLLNELELTAFQRLQNQLIVKFAALIIDAKNPKLELQAILKAAGMVLEESGETTANKYAITRQAISKKVQSKKTKLGMPQQTRDSKSIESREIYRQNNHRNFKDE